MEANFIAAPKKMSISGDERESLSVVQARVEKLMQQMDSIEVLFVVVFFKKIYLTKVV